MGSILTRAMLNKAYELTKPSALAILNMPGATWGPKMAVGFVTGPGIETFNDFCFEIDEPWNPEWGNEEKFWNIARRKLELAERMRMSTSVVVGTMPWVLEVSEFLYPGGGVYENGISVAFSGAMGWADEAIAKIFLANIIMLARLETDRRIAAGEMEI